LFAAASCSKRADQVQKPVPSSTPGAGTAAAAASTAAAAASASAPRPERGRSNVLFVTIDSMRADMPWLGYARPIAPHLTALAERCTSYTNAYSVSSYTAKSVGAFLSGRYPSTLYRNGYFFAAYPDSNEFIAEIMQRQGVATLSWHGHMYFGRGKGFEQGFDEWHLVPGITFDSETDNHVTSPKMTELGIQLLGKPELQQKSFFAWAHYMDPHDQYNQHDGTPKFGRKARDRYDSEIYFTDMWLKKLFDFVEQQPYGKHTYYVISADHGEAFGEHDMYKHAFELWEVLTRVPLLICGPGVKAQRIDARRSHIDLPPTFFDLLGVPIPPGMAGTSLWPELSGAAPPENREPIMLELAEDSHNPPRRALILGDYKLIWFGPRDTFQLYHLKRDPKEERELSKAEPEQLERMIAAYREAWGKLAMVEPFGNMKLREGGRARGPKGPDDLPRDQASETAE
jgi:arylsulfatase A-like enzyme